MSNDAQRRAREEQIRLQANGAAVMLILGLAALYGFRLLGLSDETLLVVTGAMVAFVAAGTFGLSPQG
jgi:hypothetical protein